MIHEWQNAAPSRGLFLLSDVNTDSPSPPPSDREAIGQTNKAIMQSLDAAAAQVFFASSSGRKLEIVLQTKVEKEN